MDKGLRGGVPVRYPLGRCQLGRFSDALPPFMLRVMEDGRALEDRGRESRATPFLSQGWKSPRAVPHVADNYGDTQRQSERHTKE